MVIPSRSESGWVRAGSADKGLSRCRDSAGDRKGRYGRAGLSERQAMEECRSRAGLPKRLRQTYDAFNVTLRWA